MAPRPGFFTKSGGGRQKYQPRSGGLKSTVWPWREMKRRSRLRLRIICRHHGIIGGDFGKPSARAKKRWRPRAMTTVCSTDWQDRKCLLGNTKNGLGHYKTSLEICSESDDKERASIMTNLASLQIVHGQPEKALKIIKNRPRY